jgi:5-methylcytosine-specific restriction endonuclease McrA
MALNPKIAKKVFERDGWKCRSCRFTSGLHPHHIVFKSQQGKDVLNNLITLCYSCHQGVHDHNLKLDIKEVLEDNVVVKFIRIGGWKPQ